MPKRADDDSLTRHDPFGHSQPIEYEVEVNPWGGWLCLMGIFVVPAFIGFVGWLLFASPSGTWR